MLTITDLIIGGKNMVTKFNGHQVEPERRANCYFAEQVLNKTCWHMLGVQGQWKEESWQSPLANNT